MNVDVQANRRHRWRRPPALPAGIVDAAVLLAILVGPWGCTPAGQRLGERVDRRPVLISIAASTTDAATMLAERFTVETKIPVSVNAGDSSKLAAQIVAGAPAAVFLSANRKWAELIDEKGLAAESMPLLGNRLVLIVPAGNPAHVTGLGDLTQANVRRLALAGPAVPAGMYARQALEKLNLLSALQDEAKIVDGDNVRVALAFVERGEAEAGIVYATDARIAPAVEVVTTIDPSLHDTIVYPLVLLKAAADDPGARKLFEYLQSADAAEVFEKFGFIWRPER
ncbi:MAG TPA: molybdate ABC transporter substrate-binding protein [Pirellulales bacterium]|jgi:molybdate transport system substrate-binding protein|nr:molybdate ABC transporter substrate-binding protein [Pirellulales bacterium]